MPRPFAASTRVRPSSSISAFMSWPGWLGFFIGIAAVLLMVIHKINFGCLAVRKAKHDAPIRPHRDGPVSFTLALKRVQPKSWTVQSFERFGGIECRQNIADALNQFRRQQFAVVILVKRLRPLCRKLSIIPAHFDKSRFVKIVFTLT